MVTCFTVPIQFVHRPVNDSFHSWAFAATAVVEFEKCIKSGSRISLRYIIYHLKLSYFEFTFIGLIKNIVSSSWLTVLPKTDAILDGTGMPGVTWLLLVGNARKMRTLIRRKMERALTAE